MTANPALARALRIQAEHCDKSGSLFNGALSRLMAGDLEAGGPIGVLLEPWAEADLKALFDQAMPIRLVNTFHHLATGPDAPELTAVFPQPGKPIDPDAAWRVARQMIGPHRAALTAFMDHEPQTNEVRRAICLLGGFLTVAAETGLPLRTFEVGASAGLNLNWDRFHYSFAGAEWGDPASVVQLDTDWSGPLPPLVPVNVISRAACDRRPTDLTDLAQRRRLLACVWPDQFDRAERARHAIDLALANHICVDEADAVAWTATHAAPKPGAATVLYHSVFWQYLSAETQAALRATIEDFGAQATPEAPFAWLRMEPDPDDLAAFKLRLTLWPTARERILARVHTHGAFVRWEGDTPRP